MSERNAKFEFSPRFEYIDKRDIRNAFALPRFDEFSKMRELNKPYSPDVPGWSLFRSEPMTHQTFTSDDFGSDAESVSSAGSNGSSNGQPVRSRMTRGSRVHHIPILVEARGDSSGYSSDARSEENKQTVTTNQSESSTAKSHVTQRKVNQHKPQVSQQERPSSQEKPQDYQHPSTQRSMSNQEVPYRPQEQQPKKSASQPPSSPPPQAQPGPFVTQVRLNMPVTVESKQAQQSREKKPERPRPDPRKQIEDILGQMGQFQKQVEEFTGTTKDKQYRYLDEMLTRLMLKLDDVNTDGHDGIRQERRNAVKQIQMCIARLEKKISENETKMAADQEGSEETPRDSQFPPGTENM